MYIYHPRCSYFTLVIYGILGGVIGSKTVGPPGSRSSFCSEENVCYDQWALGCFDQGPRSDFCHTVYLPQSPQEIKPEFYFYSPFVQGIGTKIDFLSRNFTDECNNLSVDLKNMHVFVVIHGFGDEWPKIWQTDVKDSLVLQGHMVVLVRWTEGAGRPNYYQAASNTRVVGAVIAKLLSTLVHTKGLRLDQTTLIGYSLGAHTAGYAGQRLKSLGRIIGVDPAGPLFYGQAERSRLDKNDADYVVVMHCNGAPLYQGGLGIGVETGDIDFFVNGGSLQPNCSSNPASLLWNNDLAEIYDGLSCSHHRCTYVLIDLIESANNRHACQFHAYKCASHADWEYGKCFSCEEAHSCVHHPFLVHKSLGFTGTYYFDTSSDQEDLCASQLRIGMQPSDNIYGKILIRIQNRRGHWSDEINYKTESGSVKAGQMHYLVQALPHSFGDIAAITLLFESEKSYWYYLKPGFGKTKFVLERFTIDVAGHTSYYLKSRAFVISGDKINIDIGSNSISNDFYNW